MGTRTRHSTMAVVMTRWRWESWHYLPAVMSSAGAEGRAVEDLGTHLRQRDPGGSAAGRDLGPDQKRSWPSCDGFRMKRSPSANTAIQYYNAVPATQRWNDLTFALARAEKHSTNSQARLAAILHTALHDAVIATWAAKYQFNRKPPSQVARDVTPAVTITGEVAGSGAIVSVRARGDRGDGRRSPDRVLPKGGGKPEGNGRRAGPDAAADGRQLPQ